MSSDLLYTTRCNPGTRRPILGRGWLTEPEARELYEMIVSEFSPDGAGDSANRDVDLTRLDYASVNGFWLDQPAFGHRDQLAAPEYGFAPYSAPTPTPADAHTPARAHRWGARRWGRGAAS